MKHATDCPVTLTTASRGDLILIVQTCPCHTRPTWDGTKGVNNK